MSILLLLRQGNKIPLGFPIAGMSNEVCNSIAYDASGNIYVAGYIDGSADFNPDPNQTTILNTAGSKIFIWPSVYPLATLHGPCEWAQRELMRQNSSA